MSSLINAYGQPIGASTRDWTARQHPAREILQGRTCRLEPLDAAQHAEPLFAAYRQAADGSDWTYLFVGPFEDLASYQAYVSAAAASRDPQHWAVIDERTGQAVGTLALMRIDGNNGVIEVGNVTFSPLMKRTAISTEVQYLLMKFVFDDLGYRRYEWKCDALNAPSRKAALRLGFSFEGIFRQAVMYKGRTRDTAWFSIIDSEWPERKAAFEAWLAENNFDAQGQQVRALEACRTGV
ncbi:GNAT family protein [Pseudomonas sp. HR96]|uniref:GNAT family N-acetyltransferase n=1 Tax=Pseudomonas sp. HR96 TaxID=1027966 RepID=UPI002A7506C2|nr:GNAT family protein [Pseudomonas sp. HR96]WPO97952.1 GNAT family protein [Pseudomonas sp. HR96]